MQLPGENGFVRCLFCGDDGYWHYPCQEWKRPAEQEVFSANPRCQYFLAILPTLVSSLTLSIQTVILIVKRLLWCGWNQERAIREPWLCFGTGGGISGTGSERKGFPLKNSPPGMWYKKSTLSVFGKRFSTGEP
jgi:hypothetical protein